MIRGALIGTGQVALNAHLPAFLDDPLLSRQVQIVAAIDGCDANRRACESRLPGIRGYRTLDDALGKENIDFVDICTPPHVRLDVIRECASRGWHILCEKPLAIDLRTALEIQALVDQWPVVFMLCHQYPFSPLWRTVVEKVRERAVGDVHLASFEAYRERADPGSKHWHAGWRQRREIAGGGILMDLGTHYFHLTHLMFGAPLSVTARTERLLPGEFDVEDTAVVVLQYATRSVEIRLSWAAPKRENRVHLVGTNGSLNYDGTTLRVECGGRGHLWTFPDGMNKSAHSQWYVHLFREFAEAVINRRVSGEALNDAISVLRCAEAAYTSARLNHTVRWADFLGVPAVG